MMDDVIARVRAYGENLTHNGAPHQTGLGRDILKLVDLVDVTNAAAITAASAAKALQDELADVRGQLADALAEKSRLADAAAENAQLRAALDAATVNASKGAEQSKDSPFASDASQKQTRKKV